jgi:hypothetical protein
MGGGAAAWVAPPWIRHWLSALDSFWPTAINSVPCNRWRHSSINGTSYSDDVKLEKLFIKNSMSWKR